MKSLAIIPARGGSKRIKKKNIRDFLGKPIIAYSIQEAVDSCIFKKVMISTDSEEIAQVGISYGAVVPFFRSKKNADEYSVLADVALEVITKYNKMGETFEYACLILPTAPFVKKENLQKALGILKKGETDCVFTVTEYSFPIQRSLKIEKGLLKMNWPENMRKRSQDLEKTYHDAGQFYFFKVDEFLKQKKLYMDKSTPITLSNLEVQDIDTETDWKLAELKYKLINNL